jgi:hypothetical protein
MTLTDSPLLATIIDTPIDRKDLAAAFNAIRNKRKDLDTLFNYYNGPQPLKYSTEKLADLFQSMNAHFEFNWCSVVVDAVLDRLELDGFQVTGNDAAGIQLTELFTRLHIDIEADEAHQASLATSQAYMIIWKQEGETVTYYNDPRICHVFYEDANPRKKRFAAKWFNRQDGSQEITLYYTDRLEHWISPKIRENQTVEKADAFTLKSVEDNTFGVIPVFELKSPGEIFKVLTVQDAINKLFADMMTSSEFGAILQRYVISNSDPGALKNSPNEIWWLPSGEGGQGSQTQVGTLEATVLSNFSNEMDKLASALFTQTSTPKHYLMATGSNISGEALLAMEAPLVKKASKRQKRFGAQWQDIAAFIAQLEGMDVKPHEIKPVWKRAESIQPLTEMQTIQTATGAGIPLESALTKQGWTEKEVNDVKKKKQESQKARLNTARVPVVTDPNNPDVIGQ